VIVSRLQRAKLLGDMPKGGFALTLACGLLVMYGTVRADNPAQASGGEPYPNELKDYQLYRDAKWKSLMPLVSTMADVRRVLGPPEDPRDIADYTKPYPGDNAAKQPVFSYRQDANWETIIYFGHNCNWLPAGLQNAFPDRVCSIELVPSKRRSFRLVTFPPVFRKQHITAVDAGWDEYADGSGLVYEVYRTQTRYGRTTPGDLNRIVYGPSADLIAKYQNSNR
jgi:hypothetical protein